jgi:hypothetical protein
LFFGQPAKAANCPPDGVATKLGAQAAAALSASTEFEMVRHSYSVFLVPWYHFRLMAFMRQPLCDFLAPSLKFLLPQRS